MERKNFQILNFPVDLRKKFIDRVRIMRITPGAAAEQAITDWMENRIKDHPACDAILELEAAEREYGKS